MPNPDDYAEDAHPDSAAMNKAMSAKLMDTMQQAIDEGLLADASIVVSMFSIIECIDKEGNSRMTIVFSDDRLVTNLGLTDYGAMRIRSMVG